MRESKKVRKGVIVAAGLGTRFLPITKVVPKEMLPILDKPVLQYIVEEMVGSGITDIIVVINKDKRVIEDYFKRDIEFENHLKSQDKHHKLKDLVKLLGKVKFSYVYQNEALGNGHAVLMAKKLIGNEPFVCSDGDGIIDAKVPATKQLLKVFYKTKSSVIGVQKIDDKKAMTRYGNVYAEPTKDKRIFRVTKFLEKPTLKKVSPHGLIVGGMRYVFNKDIWSILEKQGEGRGGEIWMADAADQLAKEQEFYAYEYEGKYLDTGNEERWLDTNNYFATKV